MVIKSSKNKFSLMKNPHNNINDSMKNTLDTKDKILINILDDPYKYIISIYLNILYKDSIILSYVNNFLIIDFTFKNNKKYKRLFYLKDIDLTKIKNISSSSLIYITIPKNVIGNFFSYVE